jgi:hypothetical protein
VPTTASRSQPLPALLALAVAIGALYWTMVLPMVQDWRMDGNYSHGCLVPLISA